MPLRWVSPPCGVVCFLYAASAPPPQPCPHQPPRPPCALSRCNPALKRALHTHTQAAPQALRTRDLRMESAARLTSAKRAAAPGEGSRSGCSFMARCRKARFTSSWLAPCARPSTSNGSLRPAGTQTAAAAAGACMDLPAHGPATLLAPHERQLPPPERERGELCGTGSRYRARMPRLGSLRASSHT